MATYREIADEFRSHAETLCRLLVPHGRHERGEWRVGSVNDESGRSLCIRLSGPWIGYWRDHATEERGDMIDLVAMVHGCSRAAAFRWASDWLGTAPPVADRVPEPAAAAAPNATPRQWIERVWASTVPAAGTPAEAYLRGRGIALAVPDCLRFARSCRHGATKQSLPAMVAAVTGPDGDRVAVHRTYLGEGGAGKAPVEPAKASLGPVSGGAVRLAPAGEVLGMAEGIETALSAMQLSDLPTWACISAGGLRAVIVPPGVRRVIIFADRDKPGAAAARDARDRLSGEGREVTVLFPAGGVNDFNDLMRARA